MSKIYEALLRAELERTQAASTGRPAPDNGADSGPAPLPLPSEQPRPAQPFQPVLPVEARDPDLDLENLAGIRTVPWSPMLESLQALNDRGSVLEQFRTLRSRLQEFRAGEPGLKTILVSSGKPQEGKSFVSLNLALSLARYKATRVLLIDGDMRRSSLQTMLGTEGAPGLTDYLSGTARLDEVLQSGTARAGEPPLHKGLASLLFLPAGSDADNAADLSGNNRFARLIAAVSPHLDWIIIDSPPVNLVTDAVNLARSVDAVLLVAKAGVTTHTNARRAMSEFKSSRLLGLVLNAVHNPPKSEGYYGEDIRETTAEPS